MHFFRLAATWLVWWLTWTPASWAGAVFPDSLLQKAHVRARAMTESRVSYELAATGKSFIDKVVEGRYEPQRTRISKSIFLGRTGQREKIRTLSEETYSKFSEVEELTELLFYLDPGRFPLIHDLSASHIPLSGTDLVGPLSDAAPSFYHYERSAATSNGHGDVTSFTVTPRDGRAECFEGLLKIRNSDGAVLEWDAGLSSQVHIFPFSRRLHVREIFDPRSGMARRAEWEFETVLPMYGMLRYATTIEVTRQTVNGNEAMADSVEAGDSGDLVSQKKDGLTEHEQQALELLSPFRSRSEKPKFWGFTALPDPRYNRVEGGYAGGIVGFRNIKAGKVIRDLSVEGSYGYGFEDRRYKHRLEMSKGLAGNQWRIGGKYFKELKEKEQDQLGGMLMNSLTALVYRYDKFHYFYVRGWEAYSHIHFRRNVSWDLRYTDRDDRSAVVNTRFALIKGLVDFDPNYPIRPGRLRRLASVFEYQVGHGKGIKPRNPYVRMEIHIAHSNNNWLRSDFDFTRLFSSARFHFPTTRRGSLDGTVYLGATRGALPQQYLFDLYGVMPYSLRTVSLLDRTEAHVQGSRIAAVVVEHNFGGELLEKTHLPIIGNGKTDLIPLLGIGFADVNGRTEDALVAPTRMLKKPLIEAGFGLGDVFRYLRFEFVWRLNQRRLGTTAFTATILTLLNDY